MKVSILHISDLHRAPDHPISNRSLLDSLVNDRRRYVSEEMRRFRPPDVIIVSGDVIYGVSPENPNPDQILEDQYAEALDFLNQLTKSFLDGDKQRIVVVPGNHDVSANKFIKSLLRVDIAPEGKKALIEQLFSRDSSLRWSWADFQLYEIIDKELYQLRLEAFSEFYRNFYDGSRNYSLDPANQFGIFDIPEFNITIAAFCSCHNNDIFNKQGDIHPECISNVSMKLEESLYQNRLRIAAWHHNTEGLPLQSDYMDPDILHNLIDRGFSLGFHGHQHRPQFIDTRFRHEGNRRITVISAGTLCGDACPRFGRAYNIVELDTEQNRGQLHLREMQNDNLLLPIWGSRALLHTNNSSLEFQYDPPPEPLVRRNSHTTSLIMAQELHDKGAFLEAAEKLVSLARSDQIARRLLLNCFGQLGDMKNIINYFDPPISNTETIYLLEALWKEGEHGRLRHILDEPMVAQSTDLSIIEMRNKYAKRLLR